MKKVVFLIFILSIIQIEAYTQVFMDRIEKNSTKINIRAGKRKLARDTEELKSYQDLVKDFKIAYLSHDDEGIEEHKKLLLKTIDKEIDQSRNKTTAGKKEIRQSEKELEASRKDLDNSAAEIAPDGKTRLKERFNFRDDQKDHRDEIRDLEDDKEDLISLEQNLKSQQDLREAFAEWNLYFGEVTDIKNAPGIAELEAFQKTMEKDLLLTTEEIKEDRRELWEDRRELREDKRARKENRKKNKTIRNYRKYQ